MSNAEAEAAAAVANAKRAHDTIQHVANSLPWLFINPNNINSNNIILIETAPVQVEREEDDGMGNDEYESSSASSSSSRNDTDQEQESTTEIIEPAEDAEGERHNPDDNDEEIIRHKLSVRAYHLRGNSWCEDWQMYIKNNHLVFGMCCHHRLHPVRNKHRIILLMGSLAFGLIVTNLVYLWDDDAFFGDVDNAITTWGDKIYNETELLRIDSEIHVAGLRMDTSQMGILWTLGSGVHSLFDFGLWHMISCGHCKQHMSCCTKTAGWTMAVFLVAIVVSITMVLSFFRIYFESEDGDEMDEQESIIRAEISTGIETALDYANNDEPDFHFLFGYLIELFLSLFVYTPIVQTVVFSGLLGCCWMPFLGGRPRSLRNEKKTALVKA